MTQIRPQLGLAVPPVDVPLVDTSGRLTEPWRVYFERVNVILGPQDDLYSVIGEGINTANELQALEGRVSLVEGRTGEQLDPAVVDGLRSEIEALRASVGALQAQKDESEARLEAVRAEINALAGSNSALMDQALSEINAQLTAAANQVEGTLLTFPRAIGELANKDDVGESEIRSGFALLQTGSGVPTATELRLYLDTSSEVLWFDDGSSVRRITTEQKTGTLASDTNFSSTSYVVVMGTNYTSAAAVNLAALIAATINYQSPAASADTATGQWAVFISDTSVATNSAVETGNFRKIAEGASAGITFATVGSVINNGDDVDDVLGGLGYVGSQIAGTAYIYLCIRVTSGGGESINLASSGSSITSILG